MSTQGIARMSRLKSIHDVPINDCGMSATSNWIEGRHPDLSAKVLIVNDSEFTYTRRVPNGFNYRNPRAIRIQLRICFVDRWFPKECKVPGILYVYEHGVMVSKIHFILHRRLTSRFTRNQLSAQGRHAGVVPATSRQLPLHKGFTLAAPRTIHCVMTGEMGRFVFSRYVLSEAKPIDSDVDS